MASFLDQAIRTAIADENRRYITEGTIGDLPPVPEVHTCSKRRWINPTRADQCPVCTQPVVMPFTRRALEDKLLNGRITLKSELPAKEPIADLVRAEVRTHDPSKYTLHNSEDGTVWQMTATGSWSAADAHIKPQSVIDRIDAILLEPEGEGKLPAKEIQ